MTEDTGVELVERHCEFCGDAFQTPKAANRPPKYCSKAWPDAPRSCQARAKQQRVAVRAAGMEVPLQVMREDTGQVVPAIEALQETLAVHLAAVQGVEDSALTRMREAEEEMQEAIARAEAESTARLQAEQAARIADRARAQAAEDLKVAERRVRDAEQATQAAVNEKWDQVGAAERAAAAAAAEASNMQAAAKVAVEERRKSDQENRDLTKANAKLERDLTGVRRDLNKAGDERDAARADVERQAGELETLRQQLTAAQAAVTSLTKQLADAGSHLSSVEQDRDRYRDELGKTRELLAGETARASASESARDELRAGAERQAAALTQLGAHLAETRSDLHAAEQTLVTITEERDQAREERDQAREEAAKLRAAARTPDKKK